MLCYPLEEPRQQHATYALWRGSHQRVSHVAEFFQRSFETQAERIETGRHGRFDHQPTNECVQEDMSGNFVVHSRRPATAHRTFQALCDFQLEKGGFSVPIIIPPKITL